MKDEEKRLSLRTLAAKLRAKRTTPKPQPQKVKPAQMKKQKKRNGSAATLSVSRPKSGPKKKNAKASPKCVKCQAYPSTPRAYTKHLWKRHKSTLKANGIYLRCACGIEMHSDTYQKHNGNCDRCTFTLQKLETPIGPKCFKCEAYPSTAWGYTKHLAKHHKTSLHENKKYLSCACGIELHTEHFKPHLARCDKRHFTLHDLNTQDLRKRRPVRINGTTRRRRPVAVADEVDEENNEETDEEDEARNVVVKKEETAEDGEVKNEEEEDTIEEKEKEAEEEEQMTGDEEEEEREAVDTVQMEDEEEKEEAAAEDQEEKMDEEKELENDDDTIPALEENEEMMDDEEDEDDEERHDHDEEEEEEEEKASGVETEEDEDGPGGFHPIDVGDVFENRYKVVEPLGSGRFSTVWLCEEPQSKETFAIKVVKSAEAFAQSARAEIKKLKRVEEANASDPHRNNIVRLIETFTITGVNGIHIAMVLEPLDCNLLTLLEQTLHKGFALEKVKTISRQVLQGLDYLHTKCNIIHTDIKPENILVKMENDEISQVKIGDLGNSCWTHKLFMEEICTPEYRPPEVLVRIAYTTAADIWSTACMAFELATGDFLLYPAAGTRNGQAFTSDAEHLANIKVMINDFPANVFEAGKRYKDYFNEEGELRHVSHKNPESLYLRLLVMYKWECDVSSDFNDFLTPMLELDQATRATAAQCLQHKWLQPDGGHAPDAAGEEESMEDCPAPDNQEPVPLHVNGNGEREE